MTTVQYALEADPGRGTASFPTFDTLEAAARAASFPAMDRRSRGVPPPRVLVRTDRGPWEPVPLPLWWCPPCDAGIAGSCTCGLRAPDYSVGVLDRCDECGRLTACRAVMDPDDPLGWVIEGVLCHPCHAGEWPDDDE